MSEVKFGKRQQDLDDAALICAVIRNNSEILAPIARISFMSYERIISLAIRHFASLSLKEQWALAKKYLASN